MREDSCNIPKVIPAGGRPLIIEAVVPEGNDPSMSKLFDMFMMIFPDGPERTESTAICCRRAFHPAQCHADAFAGFGNRRTAGLVKGRYRQVLPTFTSQNSIFWPAMSLLTGR